MDSNADTRAVHLQENLHDAVADVFRNALAANTRLRARAARTPDVDADDNADDADDELADGDPVSVDVSPVDDGTFVATGRVTGVAGARLSDFDALRRKTLRADNVRYRLVLEADNVELSTTDVVFAGKLVPFKAQSAHVTPTELPLPVLLTVLGCVLAVLAIFIASFPTLPVTVRDLVVKVVAFFFPQN